jgi:transcriptional regulator with XRE-family HTH domain
MRSNPGTLKGGCGKRSLVARLRNSVEVGKRRGGVMSDEGAEAVRSLPEVRALAGELSRLLKEAGLSQNALAARANYSKGYVSRMMRGEYPPLWDNLIATLIEAVGERRGAPMADEEVQALRVLFETAALARRRGGGLETVRESLTELYGRERALRKSLDKRDQQHALRWAGAALVVLAFTFWSLIEATKGVTTMRGDTPEEITQCEIEGRVAPACPVTRWRWSVPGEGTDEGIETVFELDTRGDTLELGGELRLDARCEATVRWALTAGADVPGELAAGTLTSGDRAGLYAPIHRETRIMIFTVRRTDSLPCEAVLLWDRPEPRADL